MSDKNRILKATFSVWIPRNDGTGAGDTVDAEKFIELRHGDSLAGVMSKLRAPLRDALTTSKHFKHGETTSISEPHKTPQ